MEEPEDVPIVVDGLPLARAIIKRSHNQATKAALSAANHISTPNDIQFCTFSDGSHKSNRGGVGLAYNRQWLPRAWIPGHTATGPSGSIALKAWPYELVDRPELMEGLGVLEALQEANNEIKRHIHVLEKHICTVQVNITTDCQFVVRAISRSENWAHKTEKAFLPQLIKQAHDLIVQLQGHGMRVIVEVRWCPRNTVPQLGYADVLSRDARICGLGYCNATGNFWFRVQESVVMRTLAQMLSGAVRFPWVSQCEAETARAAQTGVVSQSTSAVSATASTTVGKTGKKRVRRVAKRRRREACLQERAVSAQGAYIDAANPPSWPQFPLPAPPIHSLPPKPVATFNAVMTPVHF